MMQLVARPAKRFAVLLPGIAIAYVSVTHVLPYFDKKLPLGFAVLATYMLGAYVLVPALIRAYRIIVPAHHLPLYCVTPDGFASDPLNVGVVGTRRQLITAMEQAGWYMADRHSLRNVLREILSVILGWPYPNAPVSALYLFGRKQDIAFEIPIDGLGKRHHVRFWATTYQENTRLSVQSIHWQHRRQHVHDDSLLWVGAASLDSGIGPIKHNLQLTHMIDPDTDSERELIVSQLKAQKLVRKTLQLQLGSPYRLTNRVLRGYLQTDGAMTVVYLRTRKS